MIWQHFQYTKLPGDYRKRELSPALELLERAHIIIPIIQSSGNGLPLGSEANPSNFKTIMVDVALTQALHGISFSTQQYSIHKKIHSYPLYVVMAALIL